MSVYRTAMSVLIFASVCCCGRLATRDTMETKDALPCGYGYWLVATAVSSRAGRVEFFTARVLYRLECLVE